MIFTDLFESRDLCHVCGQTPCNCTHIAESAGNVGDTIRSLYQQFHDQGDDALEYLNTHAENFARYWDRFEGDLDSMIEELPPKILARLAQELQNVAAQEGLAEGSLEEVDRRGFLKGVGAAAAAGAAGKAGAKGIWASIPIHTDSDPPLKRTVKMAWNYFSPNALTNDDKNNIVKLINLLYFARMAPDDWRDSQNGRIIGNATPSEIYKNCYELLTFINDSFIDLDFGRVMNEQKSKIENLYKNDPEQFKKLQEFFFSKWETTVLMGNILKRRLTPANESVEQGVAEEKVRLDPKCWKGKKIGNPKTKMKGGVRVNNCVPAESIEENASKLLSVQDKQGVITVKLAAPDGTPRSFSNPNPSIIQRWLDKYGLNLPQSITSKFVYEQGVAENYDNGEYSDEAGMAHGNLITIAKAARGLLDTIDQHEDLPEWVQEKIAKVEGMLVSAWNYLQSQEAQGIDPRIAEMYSNLAENWQQVRQRLELTEEFNLIESIVESIAERNGVDAEAVWADLESLTEDELYVFAVTSEPIMEDWQKANKKDKTDGMSRKAVKAYRREHPGSKLQTAVTTKPSKLKKGSKASKRRKSYCSRSRGQMKMHNISCAKTPDKAICKARRRWNCEGVDRIGQPVVAEGAGNVGNAIKSLYQKIYNAGDDEIEYFYYESPVFAQYWDRYEGDIDSVIAEVDPAELQIIHDELEAYVEGAGLAEGRFVKGPGGVPLDRQGNPKPAKEPAAPAQPKLTLDAVWHKVELVASQIYPDGDPIDYLAPWLEKHGIRGFKVGEVLERAAKKHGFKDVYDYWDRMDDDLGYAKNEGVAEADDPKFVGFMNKSMANKVDPPKVDPLAKAPDWYKNAPAMNFDAMPSHKKALQFGLQVLSKLDPETKQQLAAGGEQAIVDYLVDVSERTLGARGTIDFVEEDIWECQDYLSDAFHDPNITSWADVLNPSVNEVSDATLISYLSKVDADSQKHEKDPTKRPAEKRNRSVAGFARAFNKLDARKEKTDEGQMQENELAQQMLALAKKISPNARLAGTPEQERERTQQMLAQREKDRANQPQPAGPNADERAKLEAELKSLEAQFDSGYEYSDDYTFWSKQRNIAQRIASIKRRLAMQENQNNEKIAGRYEPDDFDAMVKRVGQKAREQEKSHPVDIADLARKMRAIEQSKDSK